MIIDDDIAEPERYGFDRDIFPVYWNSHKIILLQNDAHEHRNGYRLHLLTFCTSCKTSCTMRGRVTDEKWLSIIGAAKLYCLAYFSLTDCQ